LVVLTWLATSWGETLDPMLPVYAAVGLGGVVLTALYLRHVHPAASSDCPFSASDALELIQRHVAAPTA
jgi:hypothetical protein